MTTEIKAKILLVWLYNKAGGVIGREFDPVDDPGWKDLDEEELHTLVRWLESQQLVEVYGDMDTRTNSVLTVHGISQAEELIRLRDTPRARIEIALNGLVAEAMDNFPDCRVGITDFTVLSPRAVVLDSRLEIAEVERAAEYLVKVGLFTRHSISPAAWGTAKNPVFELTALGVACAETDPVNVRKFMTEQQAPHQTITVNGPTQIGNHNTQNNTFGHDPQQLAQFARELLAAANSADITDTARARVTESVEVLEGELASDEPQPGRLRRFFDDAAQAALENLPVTVVQTVLAGVGLSIG